MPLAEMVGGELFEIGETVPELSASPPPNTRSSCTSPASQLPTLLSSSSARRSSTVIPVVPCDPPQDTGQRSDANRIVIRNDFAVLAADLGGHPDVRASLAYDIHIPGDPTPSSAPVR